VAATAAATDLITGLRVLNGIGGRTGGGRGLRAVQPDRTRARLAAVTVEGLPGRDHRLTGLLLVVIAWVAGRLALGRSASASWWRRWGWLSS
jgi:hypothetical protein